MAEYGFSITTWDHGRGHSQPVADGAFKQHLTEVAEQTLGLLPEIEKVVLHCKDAAQVTIYRKEANDTRELVGYEQRLSKMRYSELEAEAQRVNARVFSGIARPILILRILEAQDIHPEALA